MNIFLLYFMDHEFYILFFLCLFVYLFKMDMRSNATNYSLNIIKFLLN